jgi:hypothetical protein
MAKRTQEEINLQIEGLIKMKDKLPEFSFFGDNNWEKIDNQIKVLNGEATSDDFYIDEDSIDNSYYMSAQEAENWLNKETEEDLFEI